MDISLLLEYSWVLVVLVVLEGILSADNALVLAIMVKHLPPEQRRKALFYGVLGAFIFRLGALFLISLLVNIWQIQALGAAYLLFISINHLVRKKFAKKQEQDGTEKKKNRKQSGFWMTVLKVEIADVAFAIDSILAAIALAIALTPTGLGTIGGLDAGQFFVVFAGGMIGLIIMRFAANQFVVLLHKKPALETAAFIIVGWVGVKLVVATLAHPSLAIISEEFPHSIAWKLTFYGILLAVALGGWFFQPKNSVATE